VPRFKAVGSVILLRALRAFFVFFVFTSAARPLSTFLAVSRVTPRYFSLIAVATRAFSGAPNGFITSNAAAIFSTSIRASTTVCRK